jgi:DNA adenine methylase
MILRRLGNKSRIAQDIIKYFPKHNNYIELFFGAGGMFFNKPAAKYNFLNDIDKNVVNLFNIVVERSADFEELVEITPIDLNIWEQMKIKQFEEPLLKAFQFWYLSNLGYLGKPNSLKYECRTTKKHSINQLKELLKFFHKTNTSFLSHDFRDVISKISFKSSKNDWFTYSDPPYLNKTNNYNMETEWTEKDVIDCFDVTFNSGMNAALSEFAHPFILEQAKQRNLNIQIIGERQNLKNRETEILITNYQVAKGLFD